MLHGRIDGKTMWVTARVQLNNNSPFTCMEVYFFDSLETRVAPIEFIVDPIHCQVSYIYKRERTRKGENRRERK